ncbi:hypothetical protein [Cytobacillus sp. FSL R5-0596]|uniref:hypothetical protein n=1 Tax=Cytobacillus sp. FSL R5-0596 TaxID=2954696 RepID=UPI0030FAC120
MSFIKYRASVADADLLIHLGKADCLDILEHLFDEVVVPKYILDNEMLKKNRYQRTKVAQYNRKNSSALFQFKDKEQNKAFKSIVNRERSEMLKYVDQGEAECCGYAKALKIEIIISDNKNDYPDMEERGYILLGHRDLLPLLVFFNLMSKQDVESIYNTINAGMSKKSSFSFDETYDRSLQRIREKGWSEKLGFI